MVISSNQSRFPRSSLYSESRRHLCGREGMGEGRKEGGREGSKEKEEREGEKEEGPSPFSFGPCLSDKVPIRGMDQQPLLILISLSGITT